MEAASRVLIIESDTSFAEQVKQAFAQRGCAVDMFEDGDEGIGRAQRVNPQVILLAVELPRVNGFLVCKKIKKENDLKDIPLVIMSSDPNADEIFGQHRKLKTRADVYLKKPVTVAEVVSSVEQLVPTIANGAAEPDNGGFDEEHTNQVAIGDIIGMEAKNAGIDLDVDSFADSAFSQIVADPAMVFKTQDHRIPSQVPDMPPPPEAHNDEEDDNDDDAIAMDDAFEVVDNGEVEALREQVRHLQNQLQEAQLTAHRAQHEAQELQAYGEKQGKEGHQPTSREFLDLREALNTKDKEILQLRDQLTGRDKQLVESRDRSLVFERKCADFEDELKRLQEGLAVTRANLATANADKDNAQKRAEDLKARLERAESRATKAEQDLEQERVQTEAQLGQLKDTHQATLEQTRSELTQTHEHAITALRSDLEGRIEQLQNVHRESEQSLKQSHADELAKRKAEHENQMARLMLQAEQSENDALEALKKDLTSKHDDALSTLRSSLTQDFEAQVKQLEDKHSQELVVLGRKLAETESDANRKSAELTELRTSLAQLTQAKDELSVRADSLASSLARLEQELEQTQSRLRHDQAVAERVKKALAVGLDLLELDTK